MKNTEIDHINNIMTKLHHHLFLNIGETENVLEFEFETF